MPNFVSSSNGCNGNVKRIYDRYPKIRAAGIPTVQEDGVGNLFKQYLLQDKVEALIGDALVPPSKPKHLPPLRKPQPLDMRFASKTSCAELITPPMKTKFQIITNDLKETVYNSYWNKTIGKTKEQTPMLPDGFNIVGTTLGKKTSTNERLYDVIMPKEPLPDKTPAIREPGFQTCRNYLKPSFNPNLVYGRRSNVDQRGRLVQCALRDDQVYLGDSHYAMVNTVQAKYQDRNSIKMSKVLAPNQNINKVPQGFSFGKPSGLPECLSFYDINPQREFYKKCLGHLNSIRNILSKLLSPSFFNTFHLKLKYEDKNKSGWLPKEVVYELCGSNSIRFDPYLIEPLLTAINAFDGERIEYKSFNKMINFKQPLSGFPKVPDISIDYKTTYGEMTKPNQETDESLMAGVSSGRYLDSDYPVTPENYCRVDNANLPDESDMKCVLNPSIMTKLNVTHRDMYSKRDESTIRRVFEASGETFTDEQFNKIYQRAQEYHPLGWVCYETFRRSLDKQ